jgi:hypothetical protein
LPLLLLLLLLLLEGLQVRLELAAPLLRLSRRCLGCCQLLLQALHLLL